MRPNISPGVKLRRKAITLTFQSPFSIIMKR